MTEQHTLKNDCAAEGTASDEMRGTLQITAALCSYFAESDPGLLVTPQTTLRDLNIDSFSLLEAVVFLERRFGVKLPMSSLRSEDIETVARLAGRYADALKQSG